MLAPLRRGSSSGDLLAHRLMVGVSVLPNHPLLHSGNSRRMISFLAALPHPSLIFIGDVINAHNIKGFSRNPKKPPSDEKALEMAMRESQPLREVISTAIENLEKEPDMVGKVITCMR